MCRSSYIVRGGSSGRERLRILAQVMRPSTLSLLERVGLRPGMRCLDVGCGGGDVTIELARLVGPDASALGIDLDEVKLIAAITMEAIADAVLATGLATAEQLDASIAELHRLAEDDTTVMSVVRVVQTWGRIREAA